MRNVVNAFRILEALARRSGEMTLGEISAACDLPKSTTHRLLTTLKDLGYAEQASDGGSYRLGIGTLRLSNVTRARSSLVQLARPVMERLSAETGETVLFGQLRGAQLVYLYTVEPDEAVRLTVFPSPVALPHASAMGKVLVAFSADDRQLAEVLGNLESYTARTIVSQEAFLAELARIRRDGHAVNNEERIGGVRAVGVPVRDADDRCVAALSVAGPVQRLDDDRFAEVLKAAYRAGEELSALLGHTGQATRVGS